MKSLYYSPFRIGSPSFAICLDDALLKANSSFCDKVLFLTCAGEIKNCNENLFSSKIRCVQCNACSNFLVKKYMHKKILFKTLASFKKRTKSDYSFPLRTARNIHDIKLIEYNGINIGFGVVSTYVSKTRNLNPKLNPINKKILEGLLTAAAYSLDCFKIAVENFQPDEIRLFNGRFSDIRPIFEFAKIEGINIYCLEYVFGQSFNHIKKIEFKNSLPHNIEVNTKFINEYWREGDENKFKTGNEFFQRKIENRFSGNRSFTNNQKFSLLPNHWDKKKNNIVIFNSSEDEFFSIGKEWNQGRLFNSQFEGIKRICEILENKKEIMLYLRVHPNLAGLKFQYANNYKFLLEKFKNFNVIPASSKISTYSLIHSAKKIVVFGSTVGVEANYWGKPVILLGGSLYKNLNVAYSPKSIKELETLLVSVLETKPILGSIKYGYYQMAVNRGSEGNNLSFNFKSIKVYRKIMRYPNYLSFIFYSFIKLLGFFDYTKYYRLIIKNKINEECDRLDNFDL